MAKLIHQRVQVSRAMPSGRIALDALALQAKRRQVIWNIASMYASLNPSWCQSLERVPQRQGSVKFDVVEAPILEVFTSGRGYYLRWRKKLKLSLGLAIPRKHEGANLNALIILSSPPLG